MTIKEENKKMKQALIEIRKIIMKTEISKENRLIVAYHVASQALDERTKLLNDIRSGAK